YARWQTSQRDARCGPDRGAVRRNRQSIAETGQDQHPSRNRKRRGSPPAARRFFAGPYLDDLAQVVVLRVPRGESSETSEQSLSFLWVSLEARSGGFAALRLSSRGGSTAVRVAWFTRPQAITVVRSANHVCGRQRYI